MNTTRITLIMISTVLQACTITEVRVENAYLAGYLLGVDAIIQASVQENVDTNDDGEARETRLPELMGIDVPDWRRDDYLSELASCKVRYEFYTSLCEPDAIDLTSITRPDAHALGVEDGCSVDVDDIFGFGGDCPQAEDPNTRSVRGKGYSWWGYAYWPETCKETFLWSGSSSGNDDLDVEFNEDCVDATDFGRVIPGW
jgi:hypothetical protein